MNDDIFHKKAFDGKEYLAKQIKLDFKVSIEKAREVVKSIRRVIDSVKDSDIY